MRRDRRYTDVSLILLVGLLPLLWFREGYNALAGFDFAVYLNPVETLRKSYYLWSGMMAGGYDISHEISSVPYYLLFSLPVLLGASFYTAEKFVFIVLFTLQGLSIHYMLGVIFEKLPSRRAISLTGAFVYTFSYPVMAHFGRGNMMALLTYGLLPLLLGLLYRGFTRPEKEWKYIMLVSLLSLPISATKGHPADFVVLMGIVLYFVLFNAATTGGRTLSIIAFSAKAFVCSLLVNLWWVVPNIIYLRDFGLSANDLVKEGFYNLDILSYYSRGTSILNVFRNERLDLWFDIPGDMLFNPGLYQNGVFVLIGVMLPVTAFIASCIERRNKFIFFFSSLSVIAVFMGKGSHEPFGRVFEWLYIHVPGFFFFRAPYRIFSSMITFSLTPLIAYTVGMIANSAGEDNPTGLRGWLKRGVESPVNFRSLKNVTIMFFVFFFVFSTALYAWPVFTGSHLREKGTLGEPGVFHHIPGDYARADEWVRGQNGVFKVYYPYEVYDANTTWGYNGPDPSFELLSVPKVAARPGGTVYIRYQRPIESLNKALWDFRYGDLKKVLSLYNARYAILHEDFNRWVMPGHNFNGYADSLFRENDIEIKKKFGPLVFYENDEYLPRVYGAGKGYLLAGDEGSLPDLSLTGYLNSPFLVMAKDVDAVSIKDTLKDLDGVIFNNSNTIDLVCALLEKSYGGEASDETFIFRAADSGLYDIYMKDAIAAAGLKGEKTDETASGFSWRRLQSADFKSGIQTLKLKGVVSPARVVAVPHELFGEVKALVEEKLGDRSTEAAYLFGREMEKKRAVRLGGREDYLVSTMVPVQYSKKKADAFEKSLWRYEGGKRGASGRSVDKNTSKSGAMLASDFKGIDLGEYPRLVFDPGLFKEKRITLSVEIVLDGDKNLERKVEVDEAIPESGEIDLAGLVKKKFSASVYMLKRMEIGVKEKAVDATEALLKRPRLVGEFGVVKKRCRGEGGVFKLGKASFTINAGRCGEWSKSRVVKPGEYMVENGAVGDLDYLVIIRKGGGVTPEANRARGGFEMINPTRYVVRPASESTKIVFSDSFNSGWSLHMNGKKYTPLKVNGYANGFIIPRGGGTAELEYSPQRAYNYSKIASVAAVAAVIAAGRRKRKTGK